MKVVLFGYYGYGNLGDEGILTALVRHLPQVLPGVELTVLSADPEETARRLGVAAVQRMSPWAVLKALAQSDGLIAGGGSLLQDSTSWLSPWYYLAVMSLALFLNRPLLILGQGIGPVTSSLTRRAIAWVVNRAQLVVVRDEDSRRTLLDWGVRRRVLVFPDLAWLFPSPDGKGWQQPTQGSRRVLAVNLRPWPGVDEVVPVVAQVCDQAVARWGAEVVFIPMQGEDLAIGRRLQDAMEEPITLRSVPARVEELVLELSQVKATLAMRLHMVVFSLLAGAPALGLAYDPKVEALAHRIQGGRLQLEGEGLRLLKWEEITKDRLSFQLQRLWQRGTVSEEVVSTLRAEAQGGLRAVAAALLGKEGASCDRDLGNAHCPSHRGGGSGLDQ